MTDDRIVDQYQHYFCDPRIGDGVLRPGMSGVACRNIRLALRMLDFLHGFDVSDQYDDAVAKAIFAFQTKHGHSSQDGLFGRGTRKLLTQVLLQERPQIFKRMEDPREGVKELTELKQNLPELAQDLANLEKLLAVDVPSALNKIRYITEKVLHGLCTKSGVSWGQAEPTLERMIGPLAAAGRIPKSAAIHVKTVQLVASPGSHFQESELTQAHVEIAMLGLAGLLEWLSSSREESAAGSTTPPPPPL